MLSFRSLRTQSPKKKNKKKKKTPKASSLASPFILFFFRGF